MTLERWRTAKRHLGTRIVTQQLHALRRLAHETELTLRAQHTPAFSFFAPECTQNRPQYRVLRNVQQLRTCAVAGCRSRCANLAAQSERQRDAVAGCFFELCFGILVEVIVLDWRLRGRDNMTSVRVSVIGC